MHPYIQLLKDYKLAQKCAAKMGISGNHFYRKMQNSDFRFTEAEIDRIGQFIDETIDDLFNRRNEAKNWQG